MKNPNSYQSAVVAADNRRADTQLDDLKEDGFLEMILEKSRPNVREEANKLHDALREDLKQMRHTVQNPKYYLEAYMEIDQADLPRCLVQIQSNKYRIDAVLRFSLGRRWQIDDKNGSLQEAALDQYIKLPDEYDQVLGDFIPTTFQHRGRGIVAAHHFDRGTNRTAADDWPVYRSRLLKRRGKPLLGYSTGLPTVDVALGGLQGLSFLGGGAGVGKTSFAMFMAVNALRKRKDLGVLFYSLDMPKTVLLDRLLCLEAEIDYADLVGNTAGTATQAKIDAAEQCLLTDVLPRLRIVEELEVKENEPVWRCIVDDIERLMSCPDIEEVLTIVDYFQLIPVPANVNGGLDADSYRIQVLQRVQIWTAHERAASRLAGPGNLRGAERRVGPKRTFLGRSDGQRRLGYAAESVLLLETPNDGPEGKVVPVRLKIEKGRDGAVRSKIDLLFEHARYRFREAPVAKGGKKAGKATKGTVTKKADEEKIDPFAGKEK